MTASQSPGDIMASTASRRMPELATSTSMEVSPRPCQKASVAS